MTPLRSARLPGHLLILLSFLFLAACGDEDPTSSAQTGSMSAFVEDDPASGGGGGASSFSGDFTGSASISIFSEAEGWIALSPPSQINLALQSNSQGQIAANAQIPVGTYARIRFEMTAAEAMVLAGADFGAGPISANATIAVGGSDQSFTFEKEVTPFTVSANSTASVRVDVNSEVWINDLSVASQTAADAAVESATTIAVN